MPDRPATGRSVPTSPIVPSLAEYLATIDWTFGATTPDYRLTARIMDRWADDAGQPPSLPTDEIGGAEAHDVAADGPGHEGSA